MEKEVDELKPQSNQQVSNPLKSHRARVKSCMDHVLRVTLTDGRTIEGTLDCYDKQGNLILVDATDVSRKNDKPFGRAFRLGVVLVPGGVSTQVWARRTTVREIPKDLTSSTSGFRKDEDLEDVQTALNLLSTTEGSENVHD